MERLIQYLQDRADHLVNVRGKMNKETDVLERLMGKLEGVTTLQEARTITADYSEYLTRVKYGKLNGRSEELDRVVKKIDDLEGV